MKNKKTTWVFVFQKYGKFWSVSLGHFIKHNPLISEEWDERTKLEFTLYNEHIDLCNVRKLGNLIEESR